MTNLQDAITETTPDDTPAPEVVSWLRDPAAIERHKTLAQELAEEPEWTGPDYEPEDE